MIAWAGRATRAFLAYFKNANLFISMIIQLASAGVIYIIICLKFPTRKTF